jgi:hypothetical protein
MKTFEIDCFEVRESDGDGRGDHHVCYCANNTLAQKIAGRNNGWRSAEKYKQELNVCETEEEFDGRAKAALRKSAIAKLSKAEREALGV